MTVKTVAAKNPAEPLLIDLTAPSFAVLFPRKMAEAQGGTAAAADAKDTDKATNWLNSNSAGTGTYHMVRWERNTGVELRRNPNWWGGTAPFERIVIRHIADGGAQLLSAAQGRHRHGHESLGRAARQHRRQPRRQGHPGQQHRHALLHDDRRRRAQPGAGEARGAPGRRRFHRL
jgi:hypothetical protein